MSVAGRFAIRRGVVGTRGLGDQSPARQAGIGAIAGSKPGAAEPPTTLPASAVSEVPAAHEPLPPASGPAPKPVLDATASAPALTPLQRMLMRSDRPDHQQRQGAPTVSVNATAAAPAKAAAPAHNERGDNAPAETSRTTVQPAAVGLTKSSSAPVAQPQQAPAVKPASVAPAASASSSSPSSAGSAADGALARMLARDNSSDPWRMRKRIAAARTVFRVAVAMDGSGSDHEGHEGRRSRADAIANLLQHAGTVSRRLLHEEHGGAAKHADGVKALALEVVAGAMASQIENGGSLNPADARWMAIADDVACAMADARIQQELHDLGEQNYVQAKDRVTADERVSLSARLAAWEIHQCVTDPSLDLTQITQGTYKANFSWTLPSATVSKELLIASMKISREAVRRFAPVADHDGATAYAQALVRRCTALVCADYLRKTRGVVRWIASGLGPTPSPEFAPRLSRALESGPQEFSHLLQHLTQKVLAEVLELEEQATAVIDACLIQGETAPFVGESMSYEEPSSVPKHRPAG